MNQIQKDQVFMEIATQYSAFSKCQFTQVGAIAINENERIVATGVNGTLPGRKNCHDVAFDSRDQHIEFTHHNELHAEANLVLELAKTSITYRDLTIYVTISPCWECLKLLLGLNGKRSPTVSRIVYGERYHRLTEDDLKNAQELALSVGTHLTRV